MPDICPEKATAATSRRSDAASARRITRWADASSSKGSCSTQPARGRSRGTSSKASPHSLPSSSTTAALLPIVPRSHPTYTGMGSHPVARVRDHLPAILPGNGEHREAAFLDRLVVVAGVADVCREEHQRHVAGDNAAVRPPAGDVVDAAGAHGLLAVLAVVGRHEQQALTGEGEVDLRAPPGRVEVALRHVVLPA